MEPQLIPEAIAKSDFMSIFLVACAVFAIGARVVQWTWASPEANKFRLILAYTFYAFGVVLLIASLTNIPGCQERRNKPSDQGHDINPSKAKTGAGDIKSDNQKSGSTQDQ